MIKFEIGIQEELYKEAEEVFEDMGLDMYSAIKMFLKRVTKEKTVAFLLPQTNEISQEPDVNMVSIGRDESITKNLAIRLFKAKGYTFSRNVTFSSKNKSAQNYWANPDFTVLKEDWNLILNDWIKRKVYLFKVPAGAIRPVELTCRNDKKDVIDLQIAYGDISFTDNRSHYCFRPFFVDEIAY